MSIVLDFFCGMDELTMSAAVELSIFMGVHGCGWPISSRHVQIGSVTWTLWKRAPSSASEAEAIMLLSVLHSA